MFLLVLVLESGPNNFDFHFDCFPKSHKKNKGKEMGNGRKTKTSHVECIESLVCTINFPTTTH